LGSLRPRIGALPSRLGYAPGDEKARDQQRRSTQPWRAWYKTTRWQKLRQRVFLRDHYTCQLCGKLEGNTSRLIGDHKEPHRGNEAAFFNEENVWTLCKPCHDSEKQKQEKR